VTGSSILHGIRARLLLAALVLLVLPWLAAHFISSMESALRTAQEQAIGASARALAAALSDRPALFDRNKAADSEEEERRRIVALFAAADPQAVANLGSAYAPSEQIERLLGIMGRRGARLWVIDARSRVRGLSGSLAAEPPPAFGGWLKPIASLVVPTPHSAPGDESRPAREQIDRALIGVSGTPLWRGTANRDVAILSAAQPIFVGDDIVGAAVVEETTASIQLLKQSALEKLLAVTLVVVGAALAILLAFASRLATRIRRLHADAEAAIDAQGRLRAPIVPSPALDEIGDLSRTMATVMDRLREYNAYLEAMASRLSHELRTPVAVVRSSLDNLKAQPLAPEARVYVERAGEGVDRLARLISRLSEGTRLERMLESAECERFDITAVVSGCVEGYRSAYAPRKFDLSVRPEPVEGRGSTSSPRTEEAIELVGVPDAIAQALDKLVENANDFAPEGTPIAVSIVARGRGAVLSVSNAGPPLPARGRLFDSMVSLREPAEREAAHLGLGLYIVRLVAEFHGDGRGHGDLRALRREPAAQRRTRGRRPPRVPQQSELPLA
jgi:two-component system sensor histidine kinase ChvG